MEVGIEEQGSSRITKNFDATWEFSLYIYDQIDIQMTIGYNNL